MNEGLTRFHVQLEEVNRKLKVARLDWNCTCRFPDSRVLEKVPKPKELGEGGDIRWRTSWRKF